jgi:hypothetical protein
MKVTSNNSRSRTRWLLAAIVIGIGGVAMWGLAGERPVQAQTGSDPVPNVEATPTPVPTPTPTPAPTPTPCPPGTCCPF